MRILFIAIVVFGMAPRLEAKSEPELYLILSSEVASLGDLSTLAEGPIRDRLNRVSGVKEITTLGDRRPVLRIRFDTERMAAYGITLAEADAALAVHNLPMKPVGMGRPWRELVLPTPDDLPPVEELGGIVLKTSQGVPIRLRDLASLERGLEDERFIVRYADKRVVALGIVPMPGNYVLGFIANLTVAISRLPAQLPPGIQMELVPAASVSIETAPAAP